MKNTTTQTDKTVGVCGIGVTGLTKNNKLYITRNNIHSLSHLTNASHATITGIMWYGRNINAYNNMIRLGIDADGNNITSNFVIIGIDQSSSSTSEVHYNTVYIGGQSVLNSDTSTHAYRRSVAGFTAPTSVFVYNNIFMNERTSLSGTNRHFAMGFENRYDCDPTKPHSDEYAQNTESDYNFLYSSSSMVGVDQVYDSLSHWQIAYSKDLNSITGDLFFIDKSGPAFAVDLHIDITQTPCIVESAASLITHISDDIDHEIRYGSSGYSGTRTAPDVGADEINIVTIADATITQVGPFCFNDPPVSLDAVDPGGSWYLNGLPFSGLFDPSDAGVGTHQIIYDIQGPNGASDTISIVVYHSMNASITSVGPFCSNDPSLQLTAVDPGGSWTVDGISFSGLFNPSDFGAGLHEIIYTISDPCGDADTILIQVFESYSADITPAEPFCSSDSAMQLSAVDPCGSWTVNGISFNGYFNPTVVGAGSNEIIYTIPDPCGDVDTILIEVFDTFNATIQTTGPFCSNQGSVQFSAANPGGIWSGTGISSGGGLFDPGSAGVGTHTITYAMSGSCGDTASVDIVDYASPSVVLGPDISMCSGESVFLDAGAGISWEWTPFGNTQLINVTTGGTYSVTVTDINGCQGSDTISVTVLPIADATILSNGVFCSNDDPVQFMAEDSGGSWSGSGISTGGLFQPSSAGPGMHTIIYLISGQCEDADTVDILVHEIPVINLSSSNETCIGASDGTAIITVSGGYLPYMLLWSPGGASNDSMFNLQPCLYSVLVSDQNNCEATASVTISGGTDDCNPPHVFIPNIFSPNGDGENDILYVRGEGIRRIEFIVYSRWGNRVFESTDINKGWDGTYNGKPVDPAVFVYKLNVEFSDGLLQSFKGNVSLVR